MTHIIDIRALQGAGRSGVEVYIEGFLKDFLIEKKMQERERVILWVNAAADVVLPECVIEYSHMDNVQLVHTKVPNKFLNISCSLFRWPKVDRLKGLREVLGDRDGVEDVKLWVMDPRPAPVSGDVLKHLVVHDLSSLKFPHYFSLRAKLWFRIVRLRTELKEAAQIYAVSNFTKSEIIALNSSLRDKIQVKYPKVQIGRRDFTGEMVQSVRAKYGIPEGKLLLALSTLEPRKNIGGLIKEFLAKDGLGYDYLIVAGKENKRIFKKVKYVKDPRVIFTGFIEEEDKWALYYMSHGFACFSKYEGYGIPVAEAMSAALPLVLTDIPVFREVVKDYPNVTWIDPS